MEDETYRFTREDVMRTRSLAWLSYLGILFLVPMIVYPHSPYSRFHVNQGIILLIFYAILSAAMKILSFIPIVNWFSWVLGLVYIPLFVLMILGIVNTLQGRAVRLPVIGHIEIYR